MSLNFTYEAGAELPGLTFPWQEELTAKTWTDLDLSSGYTFTLTLTDSTGTAILTKTTGITGTTSGIVVTWAVGELAIAVGTYRMKIRAREVSSSKDRDLHPDKLMQIFIV